jgi:hypothetical protein
MQPDGSHPPTEDVEAQLQLLRLAAGGILDSLPCPECHQCSMTVRFTNPAPNEYRTWFVCESCSFTVRAQNSGRPPHYSDERVDNRLEAYDAKIIRKRRL